MNSKNKSNENTVQYQDHQTWEVAVGPEGQIPVPPELPTIPDLPPLSEISRIVVTALPCRGIVIISDRQWQGLLAGHHLDLDSGLKRMLVGFGVMVEIKDRVIYLPGHLREYARIRDVALWSASRTGLAEIWNPQVRALMAD